MAKLLVIDDESSIRFSIRQVFEPDGIQVLAAADTTEGLRLAAAESPDVIILDLRIGHESGLDLCRHLQRIDPDKPVIFISGFSTAENVAAAQKLGAFECLVKPLDLMQIRRVVGRAMARAGITKNRTAH